MTALLAAAYVAAMTLFAALTIYVLDAPAAGGSAPVRAAASSGKLPVG